MDPGPRLKYMYPEKSLSYKFSGLEIEEYITEWP